MPATAHDAHLAAPTRPRSRLRERLLFAAPVLALVLVLLMLWSLVAWFSVIPPNAMLEEQRRELVADSEAAAIVTEGVLRNAESSLRTVDLWLLTRGTREPLNDASLALLAETLRDTSREVVDVMLVSRRGLVFRIPTSSNGAQFDVSTRDFFARLGASAAQGLSVGLPLQVREGGALQLPMAMRLSAPGEELLGVLALVDLDRLRQLHQHFARGPEGTVTMLRSDGKVLTSTPARPGRAGSPQPQAGFSGERGFLPADDRHGPAAYQSVGSFGIQLLVSQGASASLQQHRQLLPLLLTVGALLSVLALAVTFAFGRLQRTARVRDAALLATSNASPTGLIRCDLQGRITYANDTYLRLHGLRADQAEWGWLDLMPESERASVRDKWKAHMSSREPTTFVRRMRRADGTEHLMSLRTSPLLIEGRVVGQAGSLEDITERAAQQKAQQTLTDIFDMTPDYVCQIKRSGELLYLNPAARRRLQLTPCASLAGIDFLQYYPSEHLARFRNEVLPTAMRDGHWQGRGSVLDAQGGEIPVDSTVLVHHKPGDEIETVSVIMRDISAELQALRERERSEAMLLAVADTAPALISVMDGGLRFLFFNESFAAQFGVQIGDWVGRPVRELIGEDDDLRSRPFIEQALRGQRARLEMGYGEGADSQLFEVQYGPLLLASGMIEGVICIARDITQARREETRLRHASQTDPLTQLLNRSGFSLGADEQLAQARQHNSLLGLLYLDLDRFKPVNDQHGHPVGDALLKAVAGRLRHALRPQDLVARLGGDEFAVLLPALAQASDAEVVAAKLVRAIAAPFRLDALELSVGVSVGYCVAPGGQADMDRMVAQADAQLYEAKREGRGRCCGTVLADEA